MSSPTAPLSLNQEELRTLTEMAYIAHWIVCANESFDDEDYRNKIQALEQRIYEVSAKNGNEDVLDYEADENTYYPTCKLEEESDMAQALKCYEEEFFWEELINRLAIDHAALEVGAEAWNQLSLEKKLAATHRHETQIQEAMVTRGLGALTIAPDTTE